MNDFKAEGGFCGMPWQCGLEFLISYGKRVCKAKGVTWARNVGRTYGAVQGKTDILIKLIYRGIVRLSPKW